MCHENLQFLSFHKDTIGGEEAYISKFEEGKWEMIVEIWKEEYLPEWYFRSLYAPLVGILPDNHSKHMNIPSWPSEKLQWMQKTIRKGILFYLKLQGTRPVLSFKMLRGKIYS